jgi:transcriptional regulator with XRE-family HTH domain
MKKSTHTAEYAALRAELRRIREAAGLSQRALAERLKVQPSWVAKVETGERRIDLVEFSWFVAACGGDPAALTSNAVKQLLATRSGKGGRSR